MNEHARPAPYSRMHLILGLALLILSVGAIVGSPNFGLVSIIVGASGLVILFGAISAAAVDLYLGTQCPVCGNWTMARQVIQSFHDRYYRCTSCHARCKRGFLRGWEDASGPEYEIYYARKRPENPWTAAPHVDDEDLTYSKTHVNLLVNKKRRNPNAPDQHVNRPN